MIDPELAWQTERLTAEPLRSNHAEEAHQFLRDEDMFEFTGGRPPSVTELRERFERLQQRRSPDGIEVWCNWFLRVTATLEGVGLLQATLPVSARRPALAHVAWEIGLDHQGRGYAIEAAAELAHQALDDKLIVVADIHPDHIASQRVAQHAGLTPTSQIIDGETRWRCEPA